MPRSAAVAVLAAIAAILCGPACNGNDGPVATAGEPERLRPTRLVIETDLGRVDLLLHAEEAPAHVAQITELARGGFYDGTTFHRVVPGFLVQFGDPNTKNEDPSDDGYGGVERRRLALEPSERRFRRGSVGMARDYRPDGASTQIFVTLGRAAHLDGRYTWLGDVDAGLHLLDQIAARPADERNRPIEPIPITVRVEETHGPTPEAGGAGSGGEGVEEPPAVTPRRARRDGQ